MKRNYLITVLFLLIQSLAFGQTAQKNFINYQGVARDATQEILVNTNLTLGITLHFGAPDAATSYEEIHTLTTDANGVFNVQIGSGNNVSGDYATLPWGDSAAFISVSIDGTPVGTTEIMAVPYAISSGDGQQTASEVPYDNSASGLMANNTQEAIDALVGGGTINTDNQNLELTGDVLSIEGGSGSVDLSHYINDGDFDSNNEIQDISLAGTEITISGGSTIDLAPIIPPGGTDNQNLELTGDVLSIEGGSGSVDLSNYINDADFDPNNEVDVTAQTGILLGDGTDVTGLVGTTEGQVPKWNAATSTWVPGDDETGTGGNGAEELNDLSDAITDTNTESLFIGANSGINNTGSVNTAVGDLALFQNTTGQNNTAFGASALANNETASDNTALGARALSQNRARRNTALGSEALQFNTTGILNTAVGSESLTSNTIGERNTAVGSGALAANTEGIENIAVGIGALVRNTTGNHNTAIGKIALNFNRTGNYNTAIGSDANPSNFEGSFNTTVGSLSLYNHQSGNNNTAIGSEAMASATDASQNTALGNLALEELLNGDNNMALGYDAQVPNNNGSNQVRIGNDDIDYAGIQVAWTVTSDRRWKTDVQDLPYGLNLVNELHPVDYVRKNNEHETREIGFIAQEVETVLKQLGYEDQGILTKDHQGFMSLRYNDFIPVLTKAIQEQQTQIHELKTQNNSMQAQLNGLQLLVNQLISQGVVQSNSNK